MNKVILIGNLTRDPELKSTTNGTSVCTFSIAVNRARANAAGEREADFFNIVTWQGLAENCAKYLSKGRKVGVSGRLQTRSYDDKDGNKRYMTEVVAEDVEFITSRNDDVGSNYDAPAAKLQAKKQVSELEPVDNDELPF
ncbi:MAG: single-stranded DNA-binding protein [Clostridia bacterium]|jgi:single-strand DNA-binding protein|nr:single-stranded DNA-binding protein [Clostridia bacterium]